MTEDQKQNLTLWIVALRSGTYKQGELSLAKIDSPSTNEEFKYCCLGVAAEVMNIPNKVIDYGSMKQKAYIFVSNGDEITSFSVWDAIELILTFGLERTEQAKLIKMNDNLKLSFEEIATYLEDKYLNPVVTLPSG